MSCPDCAVIDQDACQCSLISGDCFNVDGSGNAVPLTVEANLDPDPNNLLTCSPAGLLEELPVAIRNPPRVQAYSSVPVTLADGDATVISFDSERYDTDGMHLPAFPWALIFFTPGLYLVTFNCAFAANGVGDRSAFIRRNGSEFMARSQKDAFGTQECGLSVTMQDSFEAGEFVNAIVRQTSGGNLNLLANRYSPILSARFRRPPP